MLGAPKQPPGHASSDVAGEVRIAVDPFWSSCRQRRAFICVLLHHYVAIFAARERISRFVIVRRSHFRSSLIHRTRLAIAAHVNHCSSESGTVPKATLRKPRLTTATCSTTDSTIAPHNHGFTN